MRSGRFSLAPEHVVLLALLGAAMFFDGYDTSVHSVALTQIREDFGLTKGAASALYAVIFLGALPAMVITRWADRVGRRQMLMLSVFGYTAFSGLSALAPNAVGFGALQFGQQLFLIAESAIVWTMAAEELPADKRGIGFGVLGMANALGFGIGALAWGALEPAGVSWRWLYGNAAPGS